MLGRLIFAYTLIEAYKINEERTENREKIISKQSRKVNCYKILEE